MRQSLDTRQSQIAMPRKVEVRQKTAPGDKVSSDHEDQPVNEEILVPPVSLYSVTCSIVLYSTISLAIVYHNWWLFTISSLQYPVFISWIQQLVGLICFVLLGALGRKVATFQRMALTVPKLSVFRRVFPLSLSFIGMVGLANICLKFTQVSTYQVARGLTIFFTMALSFLVLSETQSRLTILACTAMVCGFIVGSIDTSTISVTGVVAGATSSAFQALYNVLIKGTLQHVENNPNIMLFYNLMISSVLFIPVIFIAGEGAVFSEINVNPSSVGFLLQWGMLVLSGLLATSLNLASYWCVKMTSPLTFNIVGFTKSVLQSLGGILILGDLVSIQSLMGLALSLFGSGMYSYVKVQETRKLDYQPVETEIPPIRPSASRTARDMTGITLDVSKQQQQSNTIEATMEDLSVIDKLNMIELQESQVLSDEASVLEEVIADTNLYDENQLDAIILDDNWTESGKLLTESLFFFSQNHHQ